MINQNLIKLFFQKIRTLTFAVAGLIRPAPAETPQGRNTARIGG